MSSSSFSLWVLLLTLTAVLCLNFTPVAAIHSIRTGRDVPNVPCIYLYKCGDRVVYIGQGGGAGATCANRLGDHFGGMKGFFTLQRTQFPQGGNILADIPVTRGGFFDHDACIAKQCIDAWQNAPGGSVMTDVMSLYYINTNQVPVPATMGLFGMTAATTRVVDINDAERTLVRLYNPTCNRKEGGLSTSNNNAIDPSVLLWTVSTSVSADDTSRLGTTGTIGGITSTQSCYPDANIRALIDQRDNLETERNNLRTSLDTARQFIRNALDECIAQSGTIQILGGLLPPQTVRTYPCPASLVREIVKQQNLWWAMCNTGAVYSMLETSSGSESQMEAGVGDEKADAALVAKCLNGQCSPQEKSQAVTIITQRRNSATCPLPGKKSVSAIFPRGGKPKVDPPATATSAPSRPFTLAPVIPYTPTPSSPAPRSALAVSSSANSIEAGAAQQLTQELAQTDGVVEGMEIQGQQEQSQQSVQASGKMHSLLRVLRTSENVLQP